MPESREEKVSVFTDEGLRKLEYHRPEFFPVVRAFKEISGPYLEEILLKIFSVLNLYPCVIGDTLYLAFWDCTNCHLTKVNGNQCPVTCKFGDTDCFQTFQPQYFHREKECSGDWEIQMEERIRQLRKMTHF